MNSSCKRKKSSSLELSDIKYSKALSQSGTSLFTSKSLHLDIKVMQYQDKR